MLKTNPRFFRFGLSAIAALCALAPLSAAFAVPLPVAGNVSIVGTTNAANPDLAGTVVRDVVTDLTLTTASGARVEFSIQDRVVKRKATGTLDFYFRVIHKADSKDAIGYVRRSKFGNGMTLDVDYRTDGVGTVGARAVQRSGAGGDVVTFDFANNPITPGKESRLHFIATKATAFDVNGLTSIVARGGGGSVALKTAQPVEATDKPTRPEQPTVRPPIRLRQPNLVVKMSGPQRAKRGEDISKQIKLVGANIGTAPAPGTVGTLAPTGGYMIDLVLSKDKDCPPQFAVYSPNFSEDVLLLGGRVSNTVDLAPGASKSYEVGATIPGDTPPGRYYLVARIDAGNKVDESNEKDNVIAIPISIY